MSFLVSDLINSTLVDLGALKPGASPSTTVQTDLFVRLNQLWETWSIDPSISNAQYHDEVTPTAGTAAYTFGTGGSLTATATPIRIYGCESVSGAFKGSVKVVPFQVFDEQVANEIGMTSVLARLMAADNSYPSINIRLHPVPAASPGVLWIDYWGAMTPFATVSTAVALAPAYTRALHWNLAMDVLPQYGRQGIDASAIASNAASSLGAIQQLVKSIMEPPPPQAAQ